MKRLSANGINYSSNNNHQIDGSEFHLVDDNVDVMNVDHHQIPHNIEQDSVFPVILDSSNDRYTMDTTTTAEESAGEKDNIMSVSSPPNIDNVNVNLDVDSKEMAVKENMPMLPIPEEQPPSTNNGKYKRIWRTIFPASDNELPVGFEAVLMELGDPGKFYWIQFMLHVLTTFSLTNTVLVYVFTGYEPAHVCQKLDNESTLLIQYIPDNSSDYEVHYGKCDITIFSNGSGVRETVASLGCVAGHDYYGNKHISFVSEWDMVCDNVGLKEVVQVILLLGQTVGSFIFTSFADKYGRKPVFVACNLLLGAAGFGVAYAPNIYVMIAFRFLCGFFQQGSNLVGTTMRMEFLTSRNRRVASVLYAVQWTLITGSFGLLAYLMRYQSWRMLQTAAALFTCNFIFNALFMCESPRWLSANKKYTQTLKIIKKACQINKRDFQKVKAVYEQQVIQLREAKELEASSAAVANVEQNSIFDIARHRTLLISCLILCFIWITNIVTYYGLYMTSSSLAGDRHLNFILIGLSVLPADVSNMFLLAFFGRKPVIMGWLLLAGTGLLTATMLIAFGSSQIARILSVAFSCVGQLGIGASYNSMFMYTPEVFPTNIRSAGLGLCAGVARIGGMISPYCLPLAEIALWAPGIIFSAMCFLSAILFTKLPETRGQPMPNTFADMKQRVARHYGNKNTNLLHYEARIAKPDELNVNS